MTPGSVVFLVDLDKTLLANDRVQEDLNAWLDASIESISKRP